MAAWVNIVLKCVDGGPLMCVMLVLREERDKTLPLLAPSASGLNVEGDDWTSSATDDRGYMLFFPRRFAEVFLHIVLPFALVSHPG